MLPILLDFPESFETERLIIRAPRPGDGPALYSAIVDSWERLHIWFDWAAAPTAPTLADTEAQVRQAHAAFIERRDLRLLLFRKETGECIGSSGLHRVDWSVPRFEIGYWIRSGFEGLGYMTEAVQGIAAFAFDVLNAQRLEIRMDAENERSAGVARRCGFELEGVLRSDSRHHLSAALRDTLIFSRLAPLPSR